MRHVMENKIYAVIDTNVIVSALISQRVNSYPLTVLSYVYSGRIIPIYNYEVIQEYNEVLTRKKFNLNSEDIDIALKIIQKYGINASRIKEIEESFPDPKDIVFYELALSKDGAYLITGNKKHFPDKQFVVTPKDIVLLLDNI